MEVREVDPSELEIDPLNERNENVGPHKDDESLEESIEKQGIIQPPVARPDNGDLRVVVGQRRTLAAQSVGLDNIPVIVMDWDDSEALEASITENIEAFEKGVSRSDRAAAVQKLMEINNWAPPDIADELGISNRSVQYWLERTRDEWESTSVHVDSSDEDDEETDVEVETHDSNSFEINKEQVDEIPDRDLATIRTGADSAEEREEVVQKVAKNDLSSEEVREAKKRADRGEQSFVETVEEVSKEKEEQREGDMKVRTETTFTGDYAVGLKRAARDYGTSEEQLVRKAIEAFLMDEGYL
ncbi:ParB/RepB/Spo0J family partition protein [Halapricum desulfuricans]|uniref:ParB-like nuclease domain containing protein n=1 Tax=Halapricum desulfuricans TaxID=2841257 RepID=A0A897NA73_9EURY|nr:ParB/RepB/Spo0J family partition protein [Halapricum desulfuricans]QSG07909.1 ParB-like nuclease domain containing protein [Halapricum desulfuricans]